MGQSNRSQVSITLAYRGDVLSVPKFFQRDAELVPARARVGVGLRRGIVVQILDFHLLVDGHGALTKESFRSVGRSVGRS